MDTEQGNLYGRLDCEILASAPSLGFNVSEYADNRRVLLPRTSAEPGPWRTSRAPYLKGIMDSFSNPDIMEIDFAKAVQTGAPLALDTPILTVEGWTTMGEIKAGETVYDEGGYPVTVLGVSENFEGRTCYEVTFSDHSKVVCDASHLWSVTDEKSYRYPKQRVLETELIAKSYRYGRQNIFAIPVTKPLSCPVVEPPIDPYTLGCWLGDGNSLSNQITSHLADVYEVAGYIEGGGHRVEVRNPAWVKGDTRNIIIDRVVRDEVRCIRGHELDVVGTFVNKSGSICCRECHRQFSKHYQYGFVMDRVLDQSKGLYKKLYEAGLIGNKYIPRLYLRASYRQRLALLQGLMDTDGDITQKGRCCFTNKSSQLIDGVFELLMTLGIKAVISSRASRKKVFPNGKAYISAPYYRIEFMVYEDKQVFRLRRKATRIPSREGRRTTETERRRITGVREVSSRPVRCIEVASDNHLFLAGKSLIPTHNSEAMYNMMCWAIEEAPAPMMMVLPTLEIATYVSRNRIQPMFEAIPSIYARRSPDPNEYNLYEMIFEGMVFNLAGANSPASLATRPVRYLFFDETDRFPAYAGREGEPIGIATERTRTFRNRKIVLVSTPTVVTGQIWKAYKAARLRYEYYVPCPFCGQMQVLQFMYPHPEKKEERVLRVLWDGELIPENYDNLLFTSWYECPYCNGHMLDYMKPEMLAKGQWIDQFGVPLDPLHSDSRTVSFHLNTLYSPWVTFGEMLNKYLITRNDPEEYINFINLWLGEPVKDETTIEIDDRLDSITVEYDPGKIPEEAVVLIETVDVQKYYLQYVVRAWSLERESWLIREATVGDFDELEQELLSMQYPSADPSVLYRPRMVLIDAGYRTEEVYDLVRKYPKFIRATKGASGPMATPYSARKMEVYPDGRRMPGGVTLWLFDTMYWKDALARRIGVGDDGEPLLDTWHLPKGVSEAYIKQLTAEEKVTSRNRRSGKVTTVWQIKQGRKRNEAFDLEVLQLLGADMLGLKFYAGQKRVFLSDGPPIKKKTQKIVVAKPAAKSNWMTNGR